MKLFILLASMLCCAAAAAQDQYLCIPDQSTGFIFKEGRWQSTNFRVATDKYLLRRAKRDVPIEKDATWVVVELGSPLPTSWCAAEFNEYGWLSCEGFNDFRINKDTLRYLSTYLLGYADGEDNDDNTPSLSIGKCSAL